MKVATEHRDIEYSTSLINNLGLWKVAAES